MTPHARLPAADIGRGLVVAVDRPRARRRPPKSCACTDRGTLPLSTLQALFDLEATNNELKAELKDLYINGAKEIDVAGGRTAVAIQVPFRLLKAFHKIQQRLVRELEKKFSGKDVVIVANRRINPVPKAGFARARPRSRTLTAVHANLLEDLVYPTEIVGKRQRYRLDGSRILKVYLTQGSQHHGVQAGHFRGRVQEDDR